MTKTESVPRIEAQLQLQFHYSDAKQQTYLKVMHQTPPLRVVRAFSEKDGAALVHLHNVSGGVLGGDVLHLSAAVGPQAQAQLTTTGATRIYKHRAGYPDAAQYTCFSVGANGILEYLPDMLIPFAQSRYRQHTRIQLDRGAGLFWWEIVAPGREAHNEVFAYDLLETAVDIVVDQRPVAIERLRIQPQQQSPDSLVRLGPYQYFATFYICRAGVVSEKAWLELEAKLAVLGQQLSTTGHDLWGVSTLAQDGLVIRALSKSGQGLQEKLITFWQLARMQLYGQQITIPRKLR